MLQWSHPTQLNMETQTWSVFDGTDIVLAIFGLIGFVSVVAVMVSASRSTGKREVALKNSKALTKIQKDNN